MKRPCRRTERGYSMMEMLVVVGIIGVLMLVTVPNFIVMRKSSIMKGALRQFTNDMRAARQRAVTASSIVRISYTPGGRTYYMWESTNEGTSWSLLGSQNPRWLPENVSIENSSGGAEFTNTIADAGFGNLPDIVFDRTGTARVPGAEGKVLLKTTYIDIPKPEYTISVRTTGMISTQ